MKKLVAILIVLGLAGVANAAFYEDFEAYADGSTLVGQGGWVDTGVTAVEAHNVNDPAVQGLLDPYTLKK